MVVSNFAIIKLHQYLGHKKIPLLTDSSIQVSWIEDRVIKLKFKIQHKKDTNNTTKIALYYLFLRKCKQNYKNNQQI